MVLFDVGANPAVSIICRSIFFCLYPQGRKERGVSPIIFVAYYVHSKKGRMEHSGLSESPEIF